MSTPKTQDYQMPGCNEHVSPRDLEAGLAETSRTPRPKERFIDMISSTGASFRENGSCVVS